MNSKMSSRGGDREGNETGVERYQLTYFNFRGVAEPIRLIFKLKGIPFEDIRLEKDESWATDHKSKYPFGLLPVLKIDEKVLSQSAAIARYLARKLDLIGDNEMEAASCDELVDSMVDLRSNWKPYWREKDASKKEDFKAQLLTTHFPQYFQKYSKVLERNGGEWLVSSRLTWADLYVAHFLEFFQLTVDSTVLDDYPELKSFKDKIFETPEIKAWTAVRPKTIL